MSPLKPPQSGRGASRFPSGTPALISWPAGRFDCEVENISRTGVLLRGTFPPPPMARVRVTLISAARDIELSLPARVARNADGATAGLGLEFLEMGPDERRQFEAVLARAIEGTDAGALAALTPASRPDEIRHTLERMPLPHRIGLASRAQAQERRWLRHDTHPQVLESLARNPNLTLTEAVGLARAPTLRASTVDVLVADPRWQANDELQSLLAAHPQAGPATVEKAAARLSEGAVTRLLAVGNLRPALRARLSSRRRGRTARH